MNAAKALDQRILGGECFVENEHMRSEGCDAKAHQHRSHLQGDVDVGRNGRHSHPEQNRRDHGDEQREDQGEASGFASAPKLTKPVEEVVCQLA